jgi:chaperone modulatory protein CbpM
MLEGHEFLLRARLDTASLEAWIEAGWLVPRQAGAELSFNELDLARAGLIRDLRDAMGVNDEGIAIVLDLLDQMHGLRHALRQVGSAVQSLPEPLQREILAQLRRGPQETPDPMAGPQPSGQGGG